MVIINTFSNECDMGHYQKLAKLLLSIQTDLAPMLPNVNLCKAYQFLSKMQQILELTKVLNPPTMW